MRELPINLTGVVRRGVTRQERRPFLARIRIDHVPAIELLGPGGDLIAIVAAGSKVAGLMREPQNRLRVMPPF